MNVNLYKLVGQMYITNKLNIKKQFHSNDLEKIALTVNVSNTLRNGCCGVHFSKHLKYGNE